MTRPLLLTHCLLLAILATVYSKSLLSYELIDRELLKLGENPKKSILVHFPANTSDLLFRQRPGRLARCYSIAPGQGNIFVDPLRVVMYKFLANKYKKNHQEELTTEESIREKINNLNVCIRITAGYIIRSVASDNPDPQGYGISHFCDTRPRFG